MSGQGRRRYTLNHVLASGGPRMCRSVNCMISSSSLPARHQGNLIVANINPLESEGFYSIESVIRVARVLIMEYGVDRCDWPDANTRDVHARGPQARSSALPRRPSSPAPARNQRCMRFTRFNSQARKPGRSLHADGCVTHAPITPISLLLQSRCSCSCSSRFAG